MVPQQKHAELTPTERLRNVEAYTPRVDILETHDELVLYADLPGVDPSSVDVGFERGELSIYGRCQPRNERVNFYLAEYGVGDYYRTFTIGDVIDSDKISAELQNGVLTVHLPKSDSLKPKKIAVKSA
jgi:HSP20 family molecular chaperone IbpA